MHQRKRGQVERRVDPEVGCVLCCVVHESPTGRCQPDVLPRHPLDLARRRVPLEANDPERRLARVVDARLHVCSCLRGFLRFLQAPLELRNLLVVRKLLLVVTLPLVLELFLKRALCLAELVES